MTALDSLSLFTLSLTTRHFNGLLSIKQSKTALRLAFMHIQILVIRIYLSSFTVFHRKSTFPQKSVLFGTKRSPIAHRSDQLDTISTWLRASHFVCLTETSKKPRTVPCSDVPFFIYSAMLNRVA